jgi:hypothetical protein
MCISIVFEKLLPELEYLLVLIHCRNGHVLPNCASGITQNRCTWLLDELTV